MACDERNWLSDMIFPNGQLQVRGKAIKRGARIAWNTSPLSPLAFNLHKMQFEVCLLRSSKKLNRVNSL